MSLATGLARGIELGRLRALLWIATLVFLALPLLIFVIDWLQPPVAVVLAVALVLVVAQSIRGGAPRTDAAVGADDRVSPLTLALALIPLGVVVPLSGVGGFGPGNWDWDKHAAILRDLIAQPWPVRYSVEGSAAGLTYYVAYHLPAAVVGKLAGWATANVALALTSLVGAGLALLWLVVLARGAPMLCSGVFVLFSGMDLLGAAATTAGRLDALALLRAPNSEWWADHWQLSSNVTLLDYVPHQALVGWLLAALALDDLEAGGRRLPALAALALGLLWSPFVVLGLLPLFMVGLIQHRRRESSLSPLRWAAGVSGVALVATLVAYFSSRFATLPLPQCYRADADVAAREGFSLVPQQLGLAPFAGQYVVFVTCEFLLLWLLLLWASRGAGAVGGGRSAVVVAGVTLLVLPLFHYGPYNDLVMRASIPALFVLQASAVRVLRRGPRNLATVGVALVLCVGALHSANLLRKSAMWMWRGRFLVRPVAEERVRDIFQIRREDASAARSGFAAQYLGSADALFFRVLARPSEPLLVPPCRPR